MAKRWLKKPLLLDLVSVAKGLTKPSVVSAGAAPKSTISSFLGRFLKANSHDCITIMVLPIQEGKDELLPYGAPVRSPFTNP